MLMRRIHIEQRTINWNFFCFFSKNKKEKENFDKSHAIGPNLPAN